MKRIALLVVFFVLTSFSGAVLAEEAVLPQYAEALRRLFPTYAKAVHQETHVYTLQDAEGAELGRVYLEYAKANGKATGFNGPIEVALAFKDGKVVGALIGANQETPRFLMRVVEGGLLDAWNGAVLEEIAQREVKAVSHATYSSKAIIADVRRLALDHLRRRQGLVEDKPEPEPSPANCPDEPVASEGSCCCE